MNRIVILGAGESGVGAATLAIKMGYEVFLSDKGIIKPKYLLEIAELGIDYESNGHSKDKILNATTVVKSPGIPKNAEIINQIKEKGIPVISEIEFASRYTDSKIVAITGSNGKTTTTSLVYHILSSAGLDVGLAGNIGDSFARKVAEKDHDYFVLEVSSFQLDDVKTFKPYIAVLLNITPDHLDQYGGKFEAYARSKFRITHNQEKEDYFVYNFDDENVVDLLKDINSDALKLPFSLETIQPSGGNSIDEILQINTPFPWKMKNEELSLMGNHNRSNSLAAALTASLLKISDDKIRQCLSDFTAIEHRLEKVSDKNGITFINDSKATNINATYFALESMGSPTVWIVGGVDKGNDYSELFDLVKEHVKAIVCLGFDNSKIIKAFSDFPIPIFNVNKMQDAVKAACSFSEKGDTVLLSPACASFDLFKNYEDRGQLFKEEVKKL